MVDPSNVESVKDNVIQYDDEFAVIGKGNTVSLYSGTDHGQIGTAQPTSTSQALPDGSRVDQDHENDRVTVTSESLPNGRYSIDGDAGSVTVTTDSETNKPTGVKIRDNDRRRGYDITYSDKRDENKDGATTTTTDNLRLTTDEDNPWQAQSRNTVTDFYSNDKKYKTSDLRTTGIPRYNPDGSVIKDEEGRIQYTNTRHTSSRTTGYVTLLDANENPIGGYRLVSKTDNKGVLSNRRENYNDGRIRIVFEADDLPDNIRSTDLITDTAALGKANVGYWVDENGGTLPFVGGDSKYVYDSKTGNQKVDKDGHPVENKNYDPGKARKAFEEKIFGKNPDSPPEEFAAERRAYKNQQQIYQVRSTGATITYWMDRLSTYRSLGSLFRSDEEVEERKAKLADDLGIWFGSKEDITASMCSKKIGKPGEGVGVSYGCNGYVTEGAYINGEKYSAEIPFECDTDSNCTDIKHGLVCQRDDPDDPQGVCYEGDEIFQDIIHLYKITYRVTMSCIRKKSYHVRFNVQLDGKSGKKTLYTKDLMTADNQTTITATGEKTTKYSREDYDKLCILFKNPHVLKMSGLEGAKLCNNFAINGEEDIRFGCPSGFAGLACSIIGGKSAGKAGRVTRVVSQDGQVEAEFVPDAKTSVGSSGTTTSTEFTNW